MPRVPSEMTVEELITRVSGRTWDEVVPYAQEFVTVVNRIARKTDAETDDDLLEIGAAVWSSMDVEHDIEEVLQGEASGEVVSLRRARVGVTA